jgi:hypothetical protein
MPPKATPKAVATPADAPPVQGWQVGPVPMLHDGVLCAPAAARLGLAPASALTPDPQP